jgi:restriction endonuclease-like protein
MISYANRLREELSLRALSWAKNNSLPHECTIGNQPCVLFREADATHGNFHPASYRCICKKPEWNRRLRKSHTSARRNLPSHDSERSELDTAASSDALLMNIFCHPQAFVAGSSLRRLLATQAPERLHFGWKPRIPLLANHIERTEIDLRIGDLSIEAKLTESEFQSAPRARVERYRDFSSVFDLDLLPQTEKSYLHYQLIRGVLSVYAEQGTRYCVICDARRPDLIDAWFSVASAVTLSSLRSQLQLATWQEIAATLPKSMRTWLSDKYGIEG